MQLSRHDYDGGIYVSRKGNGTGERKNQDAGQQQEQQAGQRDHHEEDQPQRERARTGTDQRRGGETGENRGGARVPARTPRPLIEPGVVFDPKGVIRVGFLRLARNWKDTGQPYQAMHAYMIILQRYPGTAVADTAVEDLMELAESFEQEGKFYSAMNIFNKIESLA
jgi:hypothetical protein